MTIISQNTDIINYDNIIQISVFSSEVEGTQIFSIVAFDSNSKGSVDEVDVEDVLTLGVYNSDDECYAVLSALIQTIDEFRNVYRMPAPGFSESPEIPGE